MLCRAFFLLGFAVCFSSCSARVDRASSDPMVAEMQAKMDEISKITGYGYTVGYVDAYGRDIGLASGDRNSPYLPPTVTGPMLPTDRMSLGSGTKPFTATAVMRLVDQGKVNLDDPAAKHIDPPMSKMWNTTMVKLFGSMAEKVTVHHLISMQSGLNDFDQPGYDYELLEGTPERVHSPLQPLQFVGGLTGPLGCTTGNCTWMFEPGTHVAYSSTNFVLAGLIMLHHAPPGQDTWQTMDLLHFLGADAAVNYNRTVFPPLGPLHQVGLTAPGVSIQYGADEMWKQDSSIMGWTCGYTLANGRDTAKFYYDLLGPGGRLVSAASLKVQTAWKPLDVGWDKDHLLYGSGLMVESLRSPGGYGGLPDPDDLLSYWGHGGDTYGYQSDQGFFPKMNFSLAVLSNVDFDGLAPDKMFCPLSVIAMKHLGIEGYDKIRCMPVKAPTWSCATQYGNKMCVYDYFGRSKLTKAECDKSCVKEDDAGTPAFVAPPRRLGGPKRRHWES